MLKITVEQASRDLKMILKQVAKGEEVFLIEHDRVVARLVPPQDKKDCLTETKTFRSTMQTQGESLSSTVIRTRQEERY